MEVLGYLKALILLPFIPACVYATATIKINSSYNPMWAAIIGESNSSKYKFNLISNLSREERYTLSYLVLDYGFDVSYSKKEFDFILPIDQQLNYSGFKNVFNSFEVRKIIKLPPLYMMGKYSFTYGIGIEELPCFRLNENTFEVSKISTTKLLAQFKMPMLRNKRFDLYDTNNGLFFNFLGSINFELFKSKYQSYDVGADVSYFMPLRFLEFKIGAQFDFMKFKNAYTFGTKKELKYILGLNFVSDNPNSAYFW